MFYTLDLCWMVDRGRDMMDGDFTFGCAMLRTRPLKYRFRPPDAVRQEAKERRLLFALPGQVPPSPGGKD